MTDVWFFQHRDQTWGPFSTAEIKNLAAAGLLLPQDLIWPLEADSSRAIPAYAAINFLALGAVSVPAPDWLADVCETSGPQPAPWNAAQRPDWVDDIPQELGPQPAKWAKQPAPDWLEDVARLEALEKPSTALPRDPAAPVPPIILTGSVPAPVRPQSLPLPSPVVRKELRLPSKPPAAAPPAVAAQIGVPAPEHATQPSAPPPAPAPPPCPAPIVEAVAPVIESPTASPVPPAASPQPAECATAVPAALTNLPPLAILAPPSAMPPEQSRKVVKTQLAPTQARKTVIRQMGFDPLTGEVLDPDQYKKWTREQTRETHAVSGKSIDEVFNEARRAIEAWVDEDANRDLIVNGDTNAVRRHPGLQACLANYRGYGPEMIIKLLKHLQFVPDPGKLLNTLRRAVVACHATPGRHGRLVHLQECAQVIIVGDLHGNVENFRRLLQVSELGKHPRRHLVLQELIHGPVRYPLGGDTSHQLLDLFAALKCQYPGRVHGLLGNHELAQWTGQFILKGNDDLLELFDQGVEQAYAPHAEEIRAAYDELFAALPLACRTDNGVFLSHSIPSARERPLFDRAKLEHDRLPPGEFQAGGSIHALLWGRDTSEDNVLAFLQTVSAQLLITGHIPCERGFATPNSRQLILDAADSPAWYCCFSTERPAALNDLLDGLGQL